MHVCMYVCKYVGVCTQVIVMSVQHDDVAKCSRGLRYLFVIQNGKSITGHGISPKS